MTRKLNQVISCGHFLQTCQGQGVWSMWGAQCQSAQMLRDEDDENQLRTECQIPEQWGAVTFQQEKVNLRIH